MGAFVVGPGAAELPAAGRVEGLVEDLRRPRLADGGQVDRGSRTDTAHDGPPSAPNSSRAVLRQGPHKKLTSQARTPFRQLPARTRAWLTMPGDVIGIAFQGRWKLPSTGPPSTWAA